MKVTLNEARRTLVHLIQRVNEDRVAVEITTNGASAVLISKDEYDALVETAHLLRSLNNVRRITKA